MINRFSPMERANSGKSQYTTLTLMLKLFFILVYKKSYREGLFSVAWIVLNLFIKIYILT